MDPVDTHVRNDPFDVRRREYAHGAEKFGWKQKYRKPGTISGAVKTGVGCAGAAWMSGGKGTQAEIQVNADGTFEVRVGTHDPGTGSRPVVQVVAAEMLSPESVTGRIGDSRLPPSDSNGGSQTKAAVSPAIFDAGDDVVDELKTPSGIDDPPGKTGRWPVRRSAMDRCRRAASGAKDSRPATRAGTRERCARSRSRLRRGRLRAGAKRLQAGDRREAPASRRPMGAPASRRSTRSACKQAAYGSAGEWTGHGERWKPRKRWDYALASTVGGASPAG